MLLYNTKLFDQLVKDANLEGAQVFEVRVMNLAGGIWTPPKSIPGLSDIPGEIKGHTAFAYAATNSITGVVPIQVRVIPIHGASRESAFIDPDAIVAFIGAPPVAAHTP